MAHPQHAPRTANGDDTHSTRTSALAMPRRRGVTAGTLLVLLGIWGAIIPFVGPMFDYRMDTAGAWVFTWDRVWLNILPGVAAIIGGLILIGSADRLLATLGSWLALAGGVWFVVGPSVSLLWGSPVATNGIGQGSATQRFIEQIGYFYGLGVVVTAFAAGAWARAMVRSQRDARLLANAAAEHDIVTDVETAGTTTEPAPVAAAEPTAAEFPVTEQRIRREDDQVVPDGDRAVRDDGADRLGAGEKNGAHPHRTDPMREHHEATPTVNPGDVRRTDPMTNDPASAPPGESAGAEIDRDPTSPTGHRERAVPQAQADQDGEPGSGDPGPERPTSRTTD